MSASSGEPSQGKVFTGEAMESAAYSGAVLRMPRKPAIELVDSRSLGVHALFSLLASLMMSFAAAMWTAYATCEVTEWVLVSAAMLSALAILFIGLAIVAYARMLSKKHNV